MGDGETLPERSGSVTSQLLDLPGAETRDQVAAFRARFQRAIDAGQPAPAARAWRCGRFERGLKIADELELRLGSLMGKRILDVGAPRRRCRRALRPRRHVRRRRQVRLRLRPAQVHHRGGEAAQFSAV